MDTYVILRRDGWRSAEISRPPQPARPPRASGCRTTSAGSAATCCRSPANGGLGTVCIYQASSPEAIRRHAAAADLPVDEIVQVADTVLVRPDPVPAGRLNP